MPKFILQHHYQSLILLIFMYVFHTSCGVITITRVNSCTVLRAEPGTWCFHQPSPGVLAQSSSSCSAHVLSCCSGSGQGALFGGFCLRWFTALVSQSDRCGWGAGPHHLLLATGRMSLHSVSTPPKQSW